VKLRKEEPFEVESAKVWTESFQVEIYILL
jgi:hypothetical protein